MRFQQWKRDIPAYSERVSQPSQKFDQIRQARARGPGPGDPAAHPDLPPLQGGQTFAVVPELADDHLVQNAG